VFTGIRGAQIAAHMGAIKASQKIKHYPYPYPF
jgi:hypothetical protein